MKPFEPVAFVDDNKALQGLNVARLPVYTPQRVDAIVREKNIDRVLLAVPSLSYPKQAQIVRRLEKLGPRGADPAVLRPIDW